MKTIWNAVTKMYGYLLLGLSVWSLLSSTLVKYGVMLQPESYLSSDRAYLAQAGMIIVAALVLIVKLYQIWKSETDERIRDLDYVLFLGMLVGMSSLCALLLGTETLELEYQVLMIAFEAISLTGSVLVLCLRGNWLFRIYGRVIDPWVGCQRLRREKVARWLAICDSARSSESR